MYRTPWHPRLAHGGISFRLATQVYSGKVFKVHLSYGPTSPQLHYFSHDADVLADVVPIRRIEGAWTAPSAS